LIPARADDPGICSRMINALSETAAEKPSFRKAFLEGRCLVLADGVVRVKVRRKVRVC
jgi:putative SOS response-associated peptidase YedK